MVVPVRSGEEVHFDSRKSRVLEEADQSLADKGAGSA